MNVSPMPHPMISVGNSWGGKLRRAKATKHMISMEKLSKEHLNLFKLHALISHLESFFSFLYESCGMCRPFKFQGFLLSLACSSTHGSNNLLKK
jgi:hypothetical protein